jgi:hypothetical protein
MKNKSNTEVLSIRDQKQNYDMLKSNYLDIKNQQELVSIKLDSITDENKNIKRDLQLYEKEIKSKNEIIEKLKDEISFLKSEKYRSISNTNNLNNNQTTTSNNKTWNKFNNSNQDANNINRKESGVSKNLSFYSVNDEVKHLNTMPSDSFESKANMTQFNSNGRNYTNKNISMLDGSLNMTLNPTNTKGNNLKTNIITHTYETNYNTTNSDSFYNNQKNQNFNNNQMANNNKTNSEPEKSINYNHKNQHMNASLTNNILPSQKELVKNESKILEIEIKLYNLQQERDKVITIFLYLYFS